MITHNPRLINIDDFDYNLPDSYIATHPVSPRDAARLLIAGKDPGQIEESVFSNLGAYLPSDALLLVNETRVVKARLIFSNQKGALIEIFLLNPIEPSDIQQAFSQPTSCICKVLVGNARRWKEGPLEMKLHTGQDHATLTAELQGRADNAFVVRFSWSPAHLSFGQLLEAAGRMPLPPYIKRAATFQDTIDYQTVYAQHDGSVAAPTAGLHFTDEVMQSLATKGIITSKVVLHVGAGTFKPVSVTALTEHTMHSEQIIIHKQTVETLISRINKPRILVGTTTVRTIESLYWYGVRLLTDGNNAPFCIEQWMPYDDRYNKGISIVDALEAVLEKINQQNTGYASGETRIIIAPGYQYKLTDLLITNFHQPRSTLLLLVSAFIGPLWKTVYQHAISHNFRFLSYGDACLFFPEKRNLDR